MRHKRFRQEHGDGPRGFSRWVQPHMPKYLMGCCDCGLVHEMQFRVVTTETGKLLVQFRARRAEGYTRRARKKHSHPMIERPVR